MKIKKHHLDKLRADIAAVLEKYPKVQEEYETGQFPRADDVDDLQKRFCFDLLWGAGISKWVCDELYPYMDDRHLYTALKAVCPKVERRY